MSNIYLKVPSIDELHYRQEWMKDPKTMLYNAGYDIDLKGDDKATGTITKTDEEIITWYNNWVNKEPDKYFAYIYDNEISEPIGEVYYYLENGIHSMGIIIQDKYRGKGYSCNALLELQKVAFEKNNISELSDFIPLDRIGAIKTFKKAGFIHTELQQKELVFGKESIGKQLIITRDMYFNNMFPNSIKEIVKNMSFTIDNVGRSEDKVYIFENKYVLKVSSDKNRLAREKERIDFLSNCNIPGSKSICYIEQNDKFFYLRTYINGDSLINKRFINNPELLISVLEKVIRVLRNLDEYKCPFKSTDNIGNDFVHGDLCLPNIYVNDKNEFVGFIDLDNSGLGDKWYDYSWLLWSFEYNLKTNMYNKSLLDKLNLQFDSVKYNEYIPEEYRKNQQ